MVTKRDKHIEGMKIGLAAFKTQAGERATEAANAIAMSFLHGGINRYKHPEALRAIWLNLFQLTYPHDCIISEVDTAIANVRKYVKTYKDDAEPALVAYVRDHGATVDVTVESERTRFKLEEEREGERAILKAKYREKYAWAADQIPPIEIDQASRLARERKRHRSHPCEGALR